MRSTSLLKGISVLLALLIAMFAVGVVAVAEDAAVVNEDSSPVTLDLPVEAPLAAEEGNNTEPTVPDISPDPQETVQYLLTFEDHEGNILLELTLDEGEQIKEPKIDMELAGFVFDFWYEAKLLEEINPVITAYVFGQAILEDTVLLPYYTAVVLEEETEEEVVPEDTELAQDEDGEEVTAEETDEELPIPVEISPLAGCQINITSTHQSQMNVGDIIQLNAELIGFEGMSIASYQWQYSTNGQWFDEPGATELSYSFAATSESVNYGWRLIVIVETPEA